jgi:outer membrane PBP1 activator LpoA protein
MKVSVHSKLLPVITLLLLVSGCAQQSTVQQPRPGQPGTIDTSSREPGLQESTAFSARLLEANSLLQQRQLLPAASILRELEGSKLNSEEQAELLIMQTELRYLQGDSGRALDALQQKMATLEELPLSQQWQLQQWQLRLLLARQGSLVAARHAQSLLGQFDDAAYRQRLIEFTWKNLHRCNVKLLEQELSENPSLDWQAWLELALLAAQVLDSPDVQIEELQLWQQRHPEHLLATTLPGGLDALAQLNNKLPTRIALLLPLSGALEENGRAVLDGFLASQFQARQRAWPQQQIIIMDSNAHVDINAAYDAAVAAGAELMIGPLAQEQLIAWRHRDNQPIPLMTLNWFPGGNTPAANAEQLALAPEDESRQIARLAFESDARKALLIRPQGQWGNDMSAALADRWSELDGTLHAVARYSGQQDYSSSLKEALNLAASQQRADKIRQLVALPLEFSPRRRRDIDTVFLLASRPEDARSIKPLIAFHYAGDLPVYGNSQVYSGRVDPVRDRDLNGIKLVEIPWIMEPESPIARQVADAGGDPRHGALYALGADAFLLNWRVQQLRHNPSSLFRGHSGLLSMDSEGRVHRELIPATIRRGEPEAM